METPNANQFYSKYIPHLTDQSAISAPIEQAEAIAADINE